MVNFLKINFRRFLLVGINLVLILAVCLIAVREDYFSKAFRRLSGQPTPVAESSHYKAMEAIHRRPISQALSSNDIKIAFTGDSIVEGWLTSAAVPRSLNLGIGRDTLSGLLARTNVELVLHIPAWYIGIGINDVVRGTDRKAVQKQLDELFQVYGQAQILYWREALPVEGEGWSAAREQSRQEMNAYARRRCDELSNCIFLTAPEEFEKNVNLWTSDGLHPNELGYRALTGQLCQFTQCFSDQK